MLFLHNYPFMLFDAPGGEGGGDGTRTDAPPNPENDNGNGAGAGEGTFTQDDVNRLTAEARKSGRSGAITKLLGDLNFKDEAELRKLVKSAREQQQANMSDLERANTRIQELEPLSDRVAALTETVQRYETVVIDQVKAMAKDLAIPKHVMDAISDKSAADQLDYIIKNRTAFGRTPPPDGDGDRKGPGNKIETPEQIRKNKEGSGTYGRF